MSFFTENHYWAGNRCPKAIYLLAQAAPETSFAVIDPEEQHRLLRLAAPLLPGPVTTIQGDLETRIKLTRQCLKLDQAMLGATLVHDGWVAEVDYLGPHPQGDWQLLTVVPQTSVSKTTWQRLAFQAHIVKQAGVELAHVGVLTINPSYCRGQRLVAEELLVMHSVTTAVSHLCQTLGVELLRHEAAARSYHNSMPHPGQGLPELSLSLLPIGPHCEAEGDCPFKSRCWHEHLPEHHVFHLHHLSRAKAYSLCQGGCVSLVSLPKKLRTPHREAQIYAVQTQRPHVNRPALREFLARLEYPLHCLDFETVKSSIPWLPGLRPFEMVPVQFSLTHVKAPGAAPEHETFVATGQSDPRLPILDRLKISLGRRGSILAYNAPFEQSVLETLTRFNPADEPWRLSLQPRWVDMLEPFKNFYYYHAQQKGSCSLKDVLPAVTGKGYEDLAIRDGHQATRAWQRLIFDRLPPEESAKMRQDLVAYCRRDTEGLAWLVQALQALV